MIFAEDLQIAVSDAKQSIVKRYQDRAPLGRFGRPEEAAEAALVLCSSASYVTGNSMIVDGGWTASVR